MSMTHRAVSVQSAKAIGLPHDLLNAMVDARRNVALARLTAFEDECFRVGQIAQAHLTDKIALVDFLQDVALSNGLLAAHGEGLIQLMIAAGLRGNQ